MTPRRIAGAILTLCFIATIWLANWAVKRYGIVQVWPAPVLYAPAGVYFVGLALVLRDASQQLLGRWIAPPAIIIGAALSYLVAPSLALASGVAFLLSESADFAVFTPLQKRGWNRALAASTFVAAIVDSIAFLWIAFHSLAFLKGQVVGKLSMTILALAVMALIRPRIMEPAA